MRRLSFLALTIAACSRDLAVPDAPAPPGPGSVYGRVTYARPGHSDHVPAPNATVTLLGSSLSTRSKTDGTFRLEGIVKKQGALLFRFDSDADGDFDRQRLIALEDIGAGPGHDIALGDVGLSENAKLHGKTTRADLAARGGHGGTVVFVPEGPFTTYTNDDGTWTLRDLPEGTIRVTFFRVGYEAFLIDGIDLRAGEDFAVKDVALVPGVGGADPGSLTGHVSFSPPAADAIGTSVVAYDVLGTTTAGTVSPGGDWTVSALPAGLYTVLAQRSGYLPAPVQNVLVTPGMQTTVSEIVLLQPPAGTDLDAGAFLPDAGGLVFVDGGSTLPDGGTVTCTQGAVCNAGPCQGGVVDCHAGAALCVSTGPTPDGAACGSMLVCRGGACVSGCASGGGCAVTGQPCHLGSIACDGSCVDTQQLLANGSGCGVGLVCRAGACQACNPGASCALAPGSCHAGATECSTGVALCRDSGLMLADGAPCDAARVCSGGTCITCAQGGACVPASNPCHSGQLDCTSGTPRCNDTGNAVSNGTACSAGHACYAGACMVCAGGTACVGPNECRLATIACGTGLPVCTESGNVLNGTPCDGGVCRTGTCSPPGNSIGVELGDGQSAGPDQLLPNPITLLVTGADGGGLAGATVMVTAPAGAVATLSSGTTDGTGRTTATLRLGRKLGLQVFTATSNGITTPINATAAQVADGVIYTLVNVTHAPSGNVSTGAGTTSMIAQPRGIAAALDGTLYYGDHYNQYIRKLTPEGVDRIIAGQLYAAGLLGNNGLAVNAQVNSPYGLALDEAASDGGLLYIADTGNKRVRAIDFASGIIFTVVGGGPNVPDHGDDGLADQAYLESPTHLVLGPETPPALYISDNNFNSIRRVDPVTHLITTWLQRTTCATGTSFDGCGNSDQGCRVIFDNQGNAFISGVFCGTAVGPAAQGVARRAPSGELTLLVGDAAGSSTEGISARTTKLAASPTIALDPAGNLYIMVQGDHEVRRVDAASSRVTTVVGTGTTGGTGDYAQALSAQLANPISMLFDPLNRRDLYLVDHGNNAIRVVHNLGEVTPPTASLVLTSGNGQSCFIDDFTPLPVTVRLSDGSGAGLLGYDVTFKSLTTGGTVPALARTSLNGIVSVQPQAGQKPGDHVFTASFDDLHGVPISGSPVTFHVDAGAPPADTIFSLANRAHTPGNTLVNGVRATEALLATPTGLAESPSGVLYISDSYNQLIKTVSPEGLTTTLTGQLYSCLGVDGSPAAASGVCTPRGLAYDATRGKLYIAELGGTPRIRQIDFDGGYIYAFAGGGSQTVDPFGDNGPASDATFAAPSHIRLHGDALYVADTNHQRLRKIDLATRVVTSVVVGTSVCNVPIALNQCGGEMGCDVAFDNGGAMYLSGSLCGTAVNGTTPGVVRVESNGSLTHITGVSGGSVGENVLASTANLPAVPSLGVDAQGRLLLLTGNRVRAIDLNTGLIQTVAGSTSGFAGQYTPFSSAQFNGPYEVLRTAAGHLIISDTGNNAIRIVW